MDLLDALQGSGYQTYKGKYYRRLPDPINVWEAPTLEEAERDGVVFYYEYVDVTSKQYRQSLQNVISRANADTVIKTRFAGVYCGTNGNIEGFVRLQDGTTYTVTQMRQDTNSASRQAAFFMPTPVGCEYYLNLTRIDEPFADYSASDAPTTVQINHNTVAFSGNVNPQYGEDFVIYDGTDASGIEVGRIGKATPESATTFPTVVCTTGHLFIDGDVYNRFDSPTVSANITVEQYHPQTISGLGWWALLSVSGDGTVSINDSAR